MRRERGKGAQGRSTISCRPHRNPLPEGQGTGRLYLSPLAALNLARMHARGKSRGEAKAKH